MQTCLQETQTYLSFPSMSSCSQEHSCTSSQMLPTTRKEAMASTTLTCDVMCFCFWLQMLLHAHIAAGQPVTNYITRPNNSSGKVFPEAPVSSSAT